MDSIQNKFESYSNEEECCTTEQEHVHESENCEAQPSVQEQCEAQPSVQEQHEAQPSEQEQCEAQPIEHESCSKCGVPVVVEVEEPVKIETCTSEYKCGDISAEPYIIKPQPPEKTRAPTTYSVDNFKKSQTYKLPNLPVGWDKERF